MKKHLAAAAGLALVAGLSLTAGPTATISAATATATTAVQLETPTAAGSRTPEEAQRLLAELEAQLPADTLAEYEALKRGGGTDSPRDSLLRAALNPADYTCVSNSPALAYIESLMKNWDGFDRGVFALSQFWNLLAYDAILFPQHEEHYGQNGEYDHQVTKSFRQLSGFWDIADQPIDVVPMHGEMMIDPARIARVLRLRAMPEAQVIFYSNLLATAANTEKFLYGKHPALTFNAFAAEDDEFAHLGLPVEDTIVMGDGVLETFTVLGLADVAAPAIMAHEYGHHLQFRKGFHTGGSTPEGNRRLELMADAFAAYHLTHARGAALQAKRIEQFSRVFRAIGDCNFLGLGHHGTPNQRERAAQWGYDLADSAANQGHVLPSLTVGERFDQALPVIVAPDAN
ncbi:hypothetical protein GCM10009789_75910 [Kribbella sancticallisti]|uniref:Uncharacterized protein n=1 Tax=Kribbella sancticallisti TaxID=460087 RepID=A0ABN2EL14_9ACTN